jgi:RNA polymerase sigma factor (TIGR02999 family)
MGGFDDQLYDELRGIASRMLRGERANHTLQATALVHETFMKLRPRLASTDLSEGDFLAAAAQAMRRILVDHARARNRLKRGDPSRRADLDPDLLAMPDGSQAGDVEALGAALEALAVVDADAARMVDLRFFGGLSVDQAAEAMGLSPRSAARLWQFARSWLLTKLSE